MISRGIDEWQRSFPRKWRHPARRSRACRVSTVKDEQSREQVRCQLRRKLKVSHPAEPGGRRIPGADHLAIGELASLRPIGLPGVKLTAAGPAFPSAGRCDFARGDRWSLLSLFTCR